MTVFADTDGSIKSLGSTGAKSALGGTASLSPFQTRMNTLCDSLVSLTGKRWLALGAYPAGVAIASRTNNQTVVSGGGVAATPTPLAFTNNMVQTPKTLPWFVAARMLVGGAPSGAQYALFGLHDGTNDMARCGYAGGFSNSFWTMEVEHGGVGTSQNSTIALDNNEHDFAMFYDGSTALKFYLDSVLAATISVLTNFPQTAQSVMAMAATNTGNVTEIFYAFNES